MKNDLIKKLESTFRYSSSSDELFDAFTEAVRNGVDDLEVFKVLLGNPTLSLDEIKMYAEKLIRDFSHKKYDLSIWTAKVLENNSDEYDYLESAIEYYKKAIDANPASHEPLTDLLGLYNFDLDLPTNSRIIDIVKSNVKNVELKSKVYNSLANLYKRLKDFQNEARYTALAEKAAERERKSRPSQ
ncbi:hypothetical protein MROS_1143 [Melioribacter roseus P3M-2]|uniref:Uncharacterized protein n=1 Tax=Melioribacter roseus (strain DSM 23840 / JCM 17771 / VKM B-2668 / P3M-2) TaxID=1191523 RepID=I6YUZ3_MELRP|nr:hypothetical protein [Melioribacter roseus]AFN74382.1 hypothetical protein MROS_1143 [Melioribacter roseus P3M-2]